MIKMIERLLKFSGSKRNDLLASFVFSLLDSVFEMLPILAILYPSFPLFSPQRRAALWKHQLFGFHWVLWLSALQGAFSLTTCPV